MYKRQITGHPPGNPTTVTKTVLQNITVLSAGQNMQSDATGKPVDAPSVTVLVTLAQAELLTLAGNEGRIQLVLRNGGDQVVEDTKGTSLAQLYGSHSRTLDVGPQKNRDDLSPERPKARRPVAVVAAPPPPLPPPVSVPDQIIVIRGIEKRVETMPSKKSVDDPGRNQ